MLPSGLHYFENFLTPEEERSLVQAIDSAPWSDALQRRVQHYGFLYEYTRRTIDASQHLGPLPEWLQPLSQRLVEKKLFERIPDQAIVNEYQPGQGISAHIDATVFGPVIVSVSLLSAVPMRFSDTRSEATETLVLAPCSAVAMTGEARYRWRHAIEARKTDPGPSGRIPRSRRVSVTFRSVPSSSR